MNPYSAPVADRPPRSHSVVDEDDVVTPRIMVAMTQTRPWVTALGLVYLLGAGLYGAGATLLYRYRASIASVERGYGIDALENALEHQKSFWRFMGITAAVMLGVYGLVVVGVVVMGAGM